MGRPINFLDPAFLKTAFLIFAVVSAIGIGIAILDHVRRTMIAPEDGPVDLLATLEDAHEAGEIDDVEIARVREILERKAQDQVNGPEPKVPKF
ncbi:MAG: hypothetical protein JWN86_1485 [Planctomycetota bacterium]|nr:hypothetical protein [Planctomycetota bacterium]